MFAFFKDFLYLCRVYVSNGHYDSEIGIINQKTSIKMKGIWIAFVAFFSGIASANANEVTTSDTTSQKGKPALVIRRSAQSADINNDGSTTVADLTALINILLGQEGEYNETAADVDGNETISNADVVALVKIILGINTDPDNPGISDDPPIDIGDGDLPVDARGSNISDNWDE